MSKSKQPEEQEGNERFTLFTRTSLINKLDWITRKQAFETNEKVTRTELVNQALEEFVNRYEKKNGPINLK